MAKRMSTKHSREIKLLVAQAVLKEVATDTYLLYNNLRANDDEKVRQRLKTVRSWVMEGREIMEKICPLNRTCQQSNGWKR